MRRAAVTVAASLGLALLAGAAGSDVPRSPTVGGCPTFPAGNVWNQRVDGLRVAPDSDRLLASIGLDSTLHPDFSNNGRYGIPYQVVRASNLERYRVRFEYADESDRVRYPIPARPRIENASDRHILVVDRERCKLYELYAAERAGSGWRAGSGAVWNLRSNHLRPAGWTSADAAGLPILPGLVRYDEVARGAIEHALRFTTPRTRDAYIYPARHKAGAGSDPALPPMGARLRLKASVAIDRFGPQSRVLLTALKRYGMILADNGSALYVSGAPSSRWDDDELHELGRLTAADFEVVDTSGLRNS